MSWRRNDEYYSGRRPGAIPVNRWYSVLLPSLESVAPGKATPVDKAFRELAVEMNKPYPDPAKVQTLAGGTGSELANLLTALKPVTFGAGPRKALADALARQAGAFKQPDWDDLTQAALAAAALRDAAGAPGADGQKPLDEVFRVLAFPPSYESPEGFTPHAKPEGQTEDVQALLQKIVQGLGR
jgi:hypothetical protein